MSKSATFRGTRVVAFDSKYTGEEPNWTDQAQWADDLFVKEYHRLFGFYGYYLSTKDMKPDVILFMSKTGYTEEELKIFDSLPDWVVSGTTGKIARSFNKGLDVDRVLRLCSEDIIAQAHADIRKAIRTYGAEYYKPKEDTVVSNEDSQGANKPETIQARLRRKVITTIGSDLDDLINHWMKGADKAEPLDIPALCIKHNIPGAGLKYVLELLEPMKLEYEAARDKCYPEAVEGYAYLSKKGVLQRIEALETMISACSLVAQSKKAQRKPRVKKVKAAEKQVSAFKYLNNSADYSVSSMSPLLVPGARAVFIFNTKNRVLSYLEADSESGFTVRGSGIRNFSETKSFCIRLRKPTDVIPSVVSKTPKQIEKILSALSTKRNIPNGRSNGETLILRVYNS
jgi:hypothetical protein